MNEKKFTLSNLLLILSIIVIIIMSVAIFALYSNNTKQANQISTLEFELDKSNSKVESILEANTVQPIILDGLYSLKNSELGIRFSKDGSIVYSTNSAKLEGTYTTISENLIEATFTKETLYDADDSDLISTEDISITEQFYILDTNTIIYIHTNTAENGTLLLTKYEINN